MSKAITEEMVEAAARKLCMIDGHDPDEQASHFIGGLLWTEYTENARAILSAAIPEGQMQPVAYQYRWKLDGEWTNWRVSDASQKSPHLKDLEERPLYASPPTTACVGEMKTSAGSDYYVCVRVGNRELTPHMHKIRSRAEYEVAEWQWLFNGGEKPDILAYREDAAPVPLPEIEGGDKGDGWQPIETAPKDGTDVLGVRHDFQCVVAFRHWYVGDAPRRDDIKRWRSANGFHMNPTHWRPLPAAPNAV